MGLLFLEAMQSDINPDKSVLSAVLHLPIKTQRTRSLIATPKEACPLLGFLRHLVCGFFESTGSVTWCSSLPARLECRISECIK